jgi:PIN domain nuclease of toxin-antitoxin system
MKLLLDTHTFLWFIAGSPQLSAAARALIEDAAHEKFVSVASLWEIAIKIGNGRLTLAAPFEVLIPQQISLNGFRLMNVSVAHLTLIISCRHTTATRSTVCSSRRRSANQCLLSAPTQLSTIMPSRGSGDPPREEER